MHFSVIFYILNDECITYILTRDYFDATASNRNTSAHRAPWRVSLYKDRQSNRRVGVSRFDHVIHGGPKYTNFLASV